MTTMTVLKKQEFDAGRVGVSCYYWDSASNICGMCQDGLFMPLTQHISAYCLTANYSSCAYFHKFLNQLTVNPGKSPGVRRHSAFAEGKDVDLI
jgi:hypothetical protein